MRNSKVKGFTLVELIVVIAIIAILAAILVPNMLSYIKQSRYTQADANAKNIHTAATAAMAQAYVDGILGEGGDNIALTDAGCVVHSDTASAFQIEINLGGDLGSKEIPMPGLDPKSFDGVGCFAVDTTSFAVVSAAWTKDPKNEDAMRTAFDGGVVPSKESQESNAVIVGYYPTPVAEGDSAE